MLGRIPLALSAAAFALLAALTPAFAQVDCWTPMYEEDAVGKPPFAPLRRTLLAIEQIVRRNAAFLETPEPVRMRTIISAGPYAESGARIRMNAYPPKQTTADIQLWTGTPHAGGTTRRRPRGPGTKRTPRASVSSPTRWR